MAFSKSPCNPIHEASNCEGADNSSNEGEGEDGSNVAKEVLLLHRIARVKDDRGEKDVEEDLWVECGFFIDLVVRSISNLIWKCEMGRNGEPPPTYFAFEFIQPSFILELLNSAQVFCCLQLQLVRRSRLI